VASGGLFSFPSVFYSSSFPCGSSLLYQPKVRRAAEGKGRIKGRKDKRPQHSFNVTISWLKECWERCKRSKSLRALRA